jgi:methylated-DNA-[protein]-cysteine S-methyltransferase
MGRDALIVRTALGPVLVRYDAHGVTGIQLGGRGSSAPAPAFVSRFANQLRRYAAGKTKRLVGPVNLRVGTPFQRRVWAALCRIPYGETRSYSWLAAAAGRPRAVRAAGAACGANPVPILVPCHRVRRRDGALGGFSAGLAWKRKLLALEAR